MDESIKSLDEKKWIEAIHFLKEVESMDKWKEIYGSKIYANLGKFQKPNFLSSNLAFAFAQLGDITKARHFMA